MAQGEQPDLARCSALACPKLLTKESHLLQQLLYFLPLPASSPCGFVQRDIQRVLPLSL